MHAVRAWIPIAIVQVACGHLSFERQAITGDAGLQDGDAVALDDAGNPIGPFAPPAALTTLNSSDFDEMSPTLTADLLEICFVSNRGGPFAVYCSSRGNRADPWPAPALSAVSANGDDEESVGLSADGLTMYLAITRVLSDEIDLGFATRPTRSDGWSQPQLLTGVSRSGVIDFDPQPSPDHLELWYVSDDPALSGPHLYRATRAALGDSWSAGTLVSELADLAAPSSSPAISAGGDVVYFVKSVVSLVDSDIFRVARISPTAFGTPEPVADVNSGVEESGVWIAPDQRTIAFARNETGRYDLYLATR